MANLHSRQNKGMKFLRLKKVVMIAEMALHLRCSARTVQRRFVDWQAINSYNMNGRYYTLPNIPDFDANGLWRYRGICFSRFGDLPTTFVALLRNSPTGLTAAEAGDLLGIRPSSFLWSLRDHPGLRREKHQGIYVYFSSASACCTSQRERRRLMGKTARLPSDAEAIAILVEKIKFPGMSHEDLSRRLRKQKLLVEPETIEELLVRHKLTVKKTPRSV
ncbi:MAG: hypothetical protein OET79_02300 [Nitrospirota bacterium]|nr:hypothetical protein [Nitrospirota bacterium]